MSKMCQPVALQDCNLGLSATLTSPKPSDSTQGYCILQKGFKRDEDKVRINYLEIPLNLALQHDLGDAKLFAQAGPYIGIGLSAKTKDSDGDEYEWDFGSGEDDDLKEWTLV